MSQKGKFLHAAGHSQGGNVFLNVEETVYFIDQGVLEVYYNGLPMSLQQALDCLAKEKISIEKYTAYAHLKREGYIVKRTTVYEDYKLYRQHRESDSRSPTPSPAQSQASSRQSSAGDLFASAPDRWRCPCCGEETEDKFNDCGACMMPKPGPIQSFSYGGNSSFSRLFNEIPNQASPTKSLSKNSFSFSDAEKEQTRLSQQPSAQHLESLVKILPPRSSTDRILVDVDKVPPFGSSGRIDFDIFSSGPKNFMTDPGLPDFRLAVFSYEEPSPSLAAINEMRAVCICREELKFCVVQSASVSFFSVSSSTK